MQDVQQFTVEEAREWAAFITQQMAKAMVQKGIPVTRKTLESIYFEVGKLGGAGAEIKVFFDNAGRYMEMNTDKKAQRGRDAVENITEWVKRKGLSAFGYVSGQKGRMSINQDQNINRIALGIVFGRGDLSAAATKGAATKRKRNGWWSKVFYGGLSSLYGRLMYKYGVSAGAILKDVEKNLS